MMVSHELGERGHVGLPVFREAFQVLKSGAQPAWVKSATASSVYLSKSVSKMP